MDLHRHRRTSSICRPTCRPISSTCRISSTCPPSTPPKCSTTRGRRLRSSTRTSQEAPSTTRNNRTTLRPPARTVRPPTIRTPARSQCTLLRRCTILPERRRATHPPRGAILLRRHQHGGTCRSQLQPPPRHQTKHGHQTIHGPAPLRLAVPSTALRPTDPGASPRRHKRTTGRRQRTAARGMRRKFALVREVETIATRRRTTIASRARHRINRRRIKGGQTSGRARSARYSAFGITRHWPYRGLAPGWRAPVEIPRVRTVRR